MKYDVALSFAGENRKYVEEVAHELKKLAVKVFYDNFETVDLWGKDLFTHLQTVYQKEAQYTIIFISQYYAKKLWTNHERKIAQARAFTESREYILPVRFDDTEIEGILPTTGFIDLREYAPQEFALIVSENVKRLPALSHDITIPDKLEKVDFAANYKPNLTSSQTQQELNIFERQTGKVTILDLDGKLPKNTDVRRRSSSTINQPKLLSSVP